MRTLVVAILLLASAGCRIEVGGKKKRPHRRDDCPDCVKLADIPPQVAKRNWVGIKGEGSCAWASLITVLRYQNEDGLARRVERNADSGATVRDLEAMARKAGIRYVYTENGRTFPGRSLSGKILSGADLLVWASQTRRGGVIWYKPAHACAFLGFEGDYAYIRDPNRPTVRERIQKQKFLQRWKQYGGVLFSPVHTPGTPDVRKRR